MDIKNYEKLSREYVVKVIDQYNEIDVFEKDEIPTDSTVYDMCFAIVASMNEIEETLFVKLCEEKIFKGDIEDLYEVLTEQKRPLEHMIEPPGKLIVRKPVRSVKPEETFDDQEPEKEVESSRRRGIKTEPKKEKKEAEKRTAKTGPGIDKYGLKLSARSHMVMKLAETGTMTMKEIKEKSGHSNPYIVFQRVAETTDYVIETLNKKGRKIVFVNPKQE